MRCLHHEVSCRDRGLREHNNPSFLYLFLVMDSHEIENEYRNDPHIRVCEDPMMMKEKCATDEEKGNNDSDRIITSHNFHMSTINDLASDHMPCRLPRI